MIRPGLNSLEHYYIAKYRFQVLALLNAAHSNLPRTSLGTPCTRFLRQHVPLASLRYVSRESKFGCLVSDGFYPYSVRIWICTGGKWNVTVTVLFLLLHLVRFLYPIILTQRSFKRCHPLCTKWSQYLPPHKNCWMLITSTVISGSSFHKQPCRISNN